MRYSVVSRVLEILALEVKCRQVGASNVRVFQASKQVFCDMEPGQAARLAQTPGITVSLVQEVRAADVRVLPGADVSYGVGLNLFDIYNDLRAAYQPSLAGLGSTVAVLDSGIRVTHEALVDKVVHEVNVSASGTKRDVFGHGTGITYIIAGSKNGKSGVAPGIAIMNIKVLNDDGAASEEAVVAGIEEVIKLVQLAKSRGLSVLDEMYPNVISLSIGSEDDGNPDNPLRVACRAAVEEGIQVIAAAGNSGPKASTITSPATDLAVVAVGGIYTSEFLVWENSSRGPSLDGNIKPDIVCWATSIEVASHRGDDQYDVKTGTSFAAPIITGVDGLVWDLTRRLYGPDARAVYHDWFPYARSFFIKPEGTPVDKDNNYGYGIPAVGSMIRQLLGPVSPVAAMQSMLPAMMMMLIMPSMIAGV